MSEKIYVWLLRVYPSGFLAAYGDEALQLYRDRARDERGFFPRLGLWLDLLGDLAVSIPRAYRHLRPEPCAASAPRLSNGMLSLRLLGSQPPRLAALFGGGVLSLVILGAFSILLGYVGSDAGGMATTELPGFSQQHGRHSRLQDSNSGLGDGMERAVHVDGIERRRVIDRAIANLKHYYIDKDVANKIAEALLVHEENGEDDTAKDSGSLAALLTRQMRDASHDVHLDLLYSRLPLPENARRPAPEHLALYREAMQRENCTFEKIDVLPHNVGYLKLNSFPDPAICGPTAIAAMARLNHVDAILFDLRDNRGGEPAMVALIAAYLFDHPEYWYNPRENSSRQSWTNSPVSGAGLADKPVYVLTSARTASGAEQFCYDLKMLKRATLVGETTAGVAHAGVFHRIDDHFGIAIPETRPINPFARSDWEGGGVAPDVKVNALSALKTAESLVENRLSKK